MCVRVVAAGVAAGATDCMTVVLGAAADVEGYTCVAANLHGEALLNPNQKQRISETPICALASLRFV